MEVEKFTEVRMYQEVDEWWKKSKNLEYHATFQRILIKYSNGRKTSIQFE